MLIKSIAYFTVCVMLIFSSFLICDDILKYHGDTHCSEGRAGVASIIFILSLIGGFGSFFMILFSTVKDVVDIFKPKNE